MRKESEGIRKLRMGTLFFIIAPILGIIAMLVLGFATSLSLLNLLSSLSATSIISSIMQFLTGAIVSLAIYGVAIVLYIVGLIKVRGGFKILAQEGKNVGVGYTGTSLIFISLILFVLAIVLSIIHVYFLPFLSALIYVSAILGIIGYILTNIGFYRVGSEYNEGTVKTGGILATIFIIPILPFIGYIMIYVGLGNIKS